MTRFLTSALLCSLVLLVNACGFKPVHGRAERAEYASQLESIQIVTGPGRLPQLLKAEIEDQVNPSYQRAEKLFVMTITVTETEISLFINPDGTSSRGDIQFRSTYALTRKLDGKLIDSGSLVRVASYNVSNSADYGTFVSKEDARKRGALALAEDYKLRLANLLPKINDPNAKPVVRPKVQDIPLFRLQDSYEGNSTGY